MRYIPNTKGDCHHGKSGKRGFTTVELVIVIAVIAILAAVLIPAFSGLITKANESKALQECRNALTVMLTGGDGELEYEGTYYFVYCKNPGTEEPLWFRLQDGKLSPAAAQEVDGNDYVFANSIKNKPQGGRPNYIAPILGTLPTSHYTELPYLDPCVEILCKIE